MSLSLSSPWRAKRAALAVHLRTAFIGTQYVPTATTGSSFRSHRSRSITTATAARTAAAAVAPCISAPFSLRFVSALWSASSSHHVCACDRRALTRGCSSLSLSSASSSLKASRPPRSPLSSPLRQTALLLSPSALCPRTPFHLSARGIKGVARTKLKSHRSLACHPVIAAVHRCCSRGRSSSALLCSAGCAVLWLTVAARSASASLAPV